MLKPNIHFLCALTGSLVLGAASAAFAADELGRVTAVGGDATAQQPGAAPRALKCGDAVFPGDTLRTGAGSSVGVQMDDIATHLDANSQVEIGRTAQNTPSARLISGKVRMIDPRDGGDPALLSALDADGHVKGNDAEAYIFSEKLGPYAMLCEWSDPLPVSRGNEQKTAKPGDCVIAKPKEPLYTAKAHEQRIPALAQECAPGPELASLNSPLNHLSPADVAAPGPMPGSQIAGFGPVLPAVAPAPTCDNAGNCSPAIPVVPVEPNPGGFGDPNDPGAGFCKDGCKK
jgi:hypothetical protein